MSNDETMELTSLCSELLDCTITSSEQQRLNALLKSSEEARQFYVRYSGLSASLFSYAAEMQSEAPPMPVKKLRPAWVVTALSAAAMIVLTSLWWMQREVPVTTSDTKLVALMTGTQDCVWTSPAISAGAPLQAGQKLDLKRGFAEITFDSGAQVTLEGPASMIISSAWDASLENGALKATVPKEAVGFRIMNPSVEVIELGSEFSMIADASGAEVLVLKGSVEAAARGDVKTIVLREQESRRFAPEGVSDVRDGEKKFARFARVLKLERNVMAGGYAHWSFDQSEGSVLKAEAKGKKKAFMHAKIAADAQATLTEGRWNKGLSFDGKLFAKATVPGLSLSGTARTVAFWMRVPEDASLSSGSETILGWGEKNRRRGMMPTRIGWNKYPAQGPVGAIRTEMGHTLAMGSTPVRDGRWHHVAVVLVPDPNGLMQAKQYVDGRLDGSTFTELPQRPSHEEDGDQLWLGRSPGNRNKEGNFTGALDELFVIDRALSPAEIVLLMRENRPPETSLATAL